VLLHLGVRLGADDTLGFVVLASSVLWNIWVISLGLHWVSLRVSDGETHESSIASELEVIAIDELCLGESNKFSCGHKVSSLEGSSGREGPARSALSLVLDIGDGSSSDPVNLISKVGGVELSLFESLEGLWLESIHSLHLLLGVVHEHINAHGGGLAISGVVLLDLSQLLGELVESELVFGLSSIGLSVLGNEMHELLLGGGDHVRGLVKRSGLSRHVEEGSGGGKTNGGDRSGDLFVH